jgi:hypothetical protein
MKRQHLVFKPIPEGKMSPEARVASRAHRRATKKERAELRQRGLPNHLKRRQSPRNAGNFANESALGGPWGAESNVEREL